MKFQMSQLTAAFTFLLIVSVAGSSAYSHEPIRLRVLSYNIHHAEGVDGKLDLQRIAHVIKSAKPDIVALQEVDQNVRRSQSVDQAQELGQLTKMHYAFGANIELQGGHYGNALLSRFPISNHKNVLLPNHENGEQRGVLVSEIAVPGLSKPLKFLATHFDHRKDETERISSAKFVNNLVSKSAKQPVLLAGDLNAVPDSDTLQIIEMSWKRANEKILPTIPVSDPKRQIDFILYRPEEIWRTVDVKVLEEAVASDHRAILGVLDLHP